MDTCCELRRQLAEKFATAARLYADTVVLFTRYPTNSQHDYNRLLAATEKAQERAQAAAVSFKEHVALRHNGKSRWQQWEGSK
jgi:hypothetical protein